MFFWLKYRFNSVNFVLQLSSGEKKHIARMRIKPYSNWSYFVRIG